MIYNVGVMKLPYTLQGMKMMMALNMILDKYISRDKKVSWFSLNVFLIVYHNDY